MPIPEPVSTSLIAKGIEALGGHAVDRGVLATLAMLKRFGPTLLAFGDVRVSFAVTLRVRDGDNFVLVRNEHRNEVYTPLGGVVKYNDEGSLHLPSIGFRPQDSLGTSMRNDLRGWLPSRRLLTLQKWYTHGHQREVSVLALIREVTEECDRLRPRLAFAMPTLPQLRFIHVVHEGPGKPPGLTYKQYRRAEVYELDTSHDESREFARSLVVAAKAHPDLVLASREEIIRGRSRSGKAIAHNAGWCFQKKRLPREEAPHPL